MVHGVEYRVYRIVSSTKLLKKKIKSKLPDLSKPEILLKKSCTKHKVKIMVFWRVKQSWTGGSKAATKSQQFLLEIKLNSDRKFSPHKIRFDCSKKVHVVLDIIISLTSVF